MVQIISRKVKKAKKEKVLFILIYKVVVVVLGGVVGEGDNLVILILN